MGSKTGRKHYITSRIATPTVTFGTVTSSSIVVNWTNETGRTSSVLERATSADFSVGLTTLYTGGNLTFTDTGLSASTTYYYRVRESGIGYLDSLYGTAGQATSGGGAGQLSTPSVSRLGYGVNSISVVWASVSGATGYTVQRALDSGFTTGLTTLYSGNAAGVTRAFQPGYTLEYHDSGLSIGTTYYYRVKAVDSTGTYSDSNFGTKQTTTGSSNKTANFNTADIFRACTDGAFDYWNGMAVVQVHGGDTVTLSGVDLTYFTLSGFHGTPTEPLTIRNQGDVEMKNGLSFENCSYINVTGSHASKTLSKGIFIIGHHNGPGIEIKGLCHHLNIDTIKTMGTAYSIRLKNELVYYSVDSDCGAQYWWPSRMHDIEISYMEAIEHFQDCFYVGSSAPWAGMRTITCGGSTISPRPGGLANIHIHHIDMSYIARSGFQMGGMDAGTNTFHDNTITECGWEFAVDQGAGMAIGGANGDLTVYNNTIDRTWLHSMYSYSHGLLHYHDNIHTDAGPITVDPSRPYSYMEIDLNPGQTISSSWDGQSGKRIIDNLGEYMFEYFYFNSVNSNPQLKLQRLVDTLSASKITIPTSHPTTVTFQVRDSGRAFSVGNTVKAYAAQTNGAVWIQGTVSSYSGTTLVISTTANAGTGQYRLWSIYKESRSPQAALQAVSTTALGSHAGSFSDPYVGFGASSTILSSQVTFMSEVWIPASYASSNIMINPYSSDPITTYGDPAGRKRFRIENNTLGAQKAASTRVILFLNSTNYYDTSYTNTICGNTYLGSDLTESNITKPVGVVTYSLTSSCSP